MFEDQDFTERVKLRITGRKKAEEILQLAYGESEKFNETEKDAFWSKIREISLINKPLDSVRKEQLVPMQGQELLDFEESLVPWGIHKGKKVKEAPLRYFDKLLTGDDYFLNQIRRYLKNDSISVKVERTLENEMA